MTAKVNIHNRYVCVWLPCAQCNTHFSGVRCGVQHVIVCLMLLHWNYIPTFPYGLPEQPKLRHDIFSVTKTVLESHTQGDSFLRQATYSTPVRVPGRKYRIYKKSSLSWVFRKTVHREVSQAQVYIRCTVPCLQRCDHPLISPVATMNRVMRI